MAIEVAVDEAKVESMRAILDPHADFPPTVGTNEKLPGFRLLKYDLPKGDGFALTMAALGNGLPVHRC